MNREHLLIALGAIVLAAAMGCSSKSATPSPVPEAVQRPHVVTDLSSLGPDNPGIPIPRSGVSPGPPVQASAAGEALKLPSTDREANLRRLFLEKPANIGYAGTAREPGEERLANAKAAQFSQFSRALLHQVLVAAQAQERKDFDRLGLPENVGAVALSAKLDKAGRLTELVVEQSSGSGAVDQLMVKACTTGLWWNNPPAAALTARGDYRMRIEGRIRNFARGKEDVWTFTTHLSIALD